MAVTKTRGMRSVVREYFILGTDIRREAYALLERLRHPRIHGRRQQPAQQLAPPADLLIPEDRGFLMIPPGRFPEIERIVSQVRQQFTTANPSSLQSNKKQLKTRLLDRECLTHDSPLVQFALREDLLAAVSRYLGAVPILSEIDVWWSVCAAGDYTDSQLYHCDWRDRSQIKVFIFCTDVREENGPLVLIEARASKRIRDKLGYRYGGARARVRDEQISSYLATDAEQQMAGPVGSVALVDTSRCFHYGSRLAGGASPRIMAVLQYLTPGAFTLGKRNCENRPFARLSADHLSPLQRRVLGDEPAA